MIYSSYLDHLLANEPKLEDFEAEQGFDYEAHDIAHANWAASVEAEVGKETVMMQIEVEDWDLGVDYDSVEWLEYMLAD